MRASATSQDRFKISLFQSRQQFYNDLFCIFSCLSQAKHIMKGLLPVGHTGIPQSCSWGAGAAQCSVPPCWEASKVQNT